MSKELVFEKKINDKFFAKYYLLKNDNIFGVQIELFDTDMNLKTCESVDKITREHDLALKILEQLVKNDVTPNSLLYVIDEIFDMVQNK